MVHQKVSNNLEVSHSHFQKVHTAGKQNAVFPCDTSKERRGLVQSENPETFHIDVSSVEMAQGVLLHKNSPSSPLLKMLKRWNNSKQVISFWISSVKRELEAAPKFRKEKSLPPADGETF